MNLEEQPVPQDNTPRPFREIPALWLKLGEMTGAFFRQELPRASASNTFFAILVFTAIAAPLSIVQFILSSIINPQGASGGASATTAATAIGTAALTLCCIELFIPTISFYLNVGITYVSAKVFGGRGTFSAQAYLTSLYFVPLGLISSLFGYISLVPRLGIYMFSLLALGVGIFHLRLTVSQFKVVHGFSTGRAVAAVLAPLVLLVIPICLIAILTLMGPMVGNVFSSINASLGTPAP